MGEEQSFIRWLVCGDILLMPLDSLSLSLGENRARLVGQKNKNRMDRILCGYSRLVVDSLIVPYYSLT